MDSTNYHVVESIHLPPNNEGELVPYSPSANVLHRGFKAIIHIIQICLISTRFENEQKKLSCFLLKKLRTMLKNNVCMIEIKSLCICLWLFDISTLHKKKKRNCGSIGNDNTITYSYRAVRDIAQQQKHTLKLSNTNFHIAASEREAEYNVCDKLKNFYIIDKVSL